MAMKILSVRRGFATNSISSHTLIFWPGAKDENVPREREFGWQKFVLASEEAKKQYLAVILVNSFHSHLGLGRDEPKVRKSVKKLLGVDIKKDVNNQKGRGLGDFIDHESAIYIPMSHDCSTLHEGFMQRFFKYILEDGMVIVGGNDNDQPGEQHPLVKTDMSFQIPMQGLIGKLVCKNASRSTTYLDSMTLEDVEFPGSVWTIFDRESGTKMTVDFDYPNLQDTDDDDAPLYPHSYLRPRTPDLVDVSITDYCDQGCSFCYKGSTTEGQHADSADVKNLAKMLSEMEVFEVAIGGGEPTTHPDFLKIIKFFSNRNVVPNFTTRNLDYLLGLSKKKLNTLAKQIGGFAVSVDNLKTAESAIEELHKLSLKCEPLAEKASFQFIVGRHSNVGVMLDVLNIVDANELNVTLLGLKNTHRGKDTAHFPGLRWFHALKEWMDENFRYISVGIDTSLAKEWEEELGKSVDSIFYHTQEGQVSCYIDAVAKTWDPSSYHLDKLKPLPESVGEMRREWAYDIQPI